MQPIPLDFKTRSYEGNEYAPLDIYDTHTADNEPVMVSLWQPSVEELDALNHGGFVQLNILGEAHPPVMVEVYSHETEEEESP